MLEGISVTLRIWKVYYNFRVADVFTGISSPKENRKTVDTIFTVFLRQLRRFGFTLLH